MTTRLSAGSASENFGSAQLKTAAIPTSGSLYTFVVADTPSWLTLVLSGTLFFDTLQYGT